MIPWLYPRSVRRVWWACPSHWMMTRTSTALVILQGSLLMKTFNFCVFNSSNFIAGWMPHHAVSAGKYINTLICLTNTSLDSQLFPRQGRHQRPGWEPWEETFILHVLSVRWEYWPPLYLGTEDSDLLCTCFTQDCGQVLGEEYYPLGERPYCRTCRSKRQT